MYTKHASLAIVSLLFLFLILFVYKSVNYMFSIPFHDFDEAHRAETAKRMKENKSYFVPLTGSQFDRVDNLSRPFLPNPDLNLFYHLERPFLVYILMIASTTLFGSFEFAYRLPSFLLGILTILTYFLFSKRANKNTSIFALSLGGLALLTSSDLWLSSQYSQLDTGLTAFLFLSLLTLIEYAEKKRLPFLILSGVSFALAVLSKGQPAIIFLFPLITLFVLRKISLKDLLLFFVFSGIFLLPWVALLSLKFGFLRFMQIFIGFGFSSVERYSHQVAPVLWYGRWWFETLRPGWVLFIALFIIDSLSLKIEWKKLTLLSFILGGLFVFSIQTNKIWWYVLPLVPAIAFYIYLSSAEYLKQNSNKLISISLVALLGSLPIFLNSTNKEVLIYGISITAVALVLIKTRVSSLFTFLYKYKEAVFFVSLLLSLSFFYYRFPKIIPYHWETKEVASYFSKLPGRNCLWVYDMPPEAALFYSNAGEVLAFNLEESKSLFSRSNRCDHYLITTNNIDSKELSYIPQKEIVYQKGAISLIRLRKNPY